jgi:hypothetical protein
VIALALAAIAAGARGELVSFAPLTHDDNVGALPQRKAQTGVSGDHLLRTADDFTGATFNPRGCFSFNFMNPVGVQMPDYPRGYAEGIHAMTGTVVLDVDLAAGGAVGVRELALDGDVAPGKPAARQRLIHPGDPAADGSCGPVDGLPNSGSYSASAGADWAVTLTFDWYYDTPFAGPGGIDVTFDDYVWSGLLIPIRELTQAGMAGVTLDDPLGYFPGTSDDFETWLLGEVAPRVPPEATYLLFAQGEAHPAWTDPDMGMTTEGIVAATFLGFTTQAGQETPIPEPGTWMLLTCGIVGAAWRALRRRP